MGTCICQHSKGVLQFYIESGTEEDRWTGVLDQIRLYEWVEKDEVYILRQVVPLEWKMLPAVDVALTFADPSSSDKYCRDIIPWVKKLNSQIDVTTDYFSSNVEGEAELLKHKATIQEGLELSLAIAVAKSNREKYVDKLKLFSSSHFTSALKAVIDELTTRSSLLKDVYNTTNGHWSKVKIFLDRILPLIVGALIAKAVYETYTSRKAEESLQPYKKQMEEIEKNIQSVFDRCKSEFKENMLTDLNEALDRSVSNDIAVDNLSALMSAKYDWLVNYCIICNESISLNYCFLGNHVKSLKRNGKFGVIFYRDALMDETVDYEKWKDVNSALVDLAKNSSAYTYAEDLCQSMISTYEAKDIEVCACAVMRPEAAMQWIPFYGTPAMMAYGTSMATLRMKGSCVTVCENWLNDPLRINPVDVVFFPVGVPLVATETLVDHFREAESKQRFFVVLYKP